MSNRIKSETIYRVDHIPGEEIDQAQELEGMQSYRQYDESGRLILEIAYTRDGEISDKMEYRHDPEGRLRETLIYGDDNEVLERREVVWGDDKRISQEIIHYQDGSADLHDFFYDEEGNMTGLQVSDDEGELEFSEKYFYEGDQIVRVERMDGDDELIFKQEDIYENGVLKLRSIWSSEEEEPFRMVQHFNAKGHRTEELRYDNRDNLVERNTYELDSRGLVILMIEENKFRKNTTAFSYDENGNVIYQKETDMNGIITHEIFRFFNPEGELIRTTVEAVIRPSMEKRAYSLILRREVYEE
jgi:antitoxin component YwqK of YwqJK toxin-antitoxin module